jgi:hypothetical protein
LELKPEESVESLSAVALTAVKAKIEAAIKEHQSQ